MLYYGDLGYDNDDPYHDKDSDDNGNNNNADDDYDNMLAGHSCHAEGVEEQGKPKVCEGRVVILVVTAAGEVFFMRGGKAG